MFINVLKKVYKKENIGYVDFELLAKIHLLNYLQINPLKTINEFLIDIGEDSIEQKDLEDDGLYYYIK